MVAFALRYGHWTVAVPYRQLAEEVLAQWRDAERRLEMADEADREEILREIKALRETYRNVVEEARRAHAPEPPPFPSGA